MNINLLNTLNFAEDLAIKAGALLLKHQAKAQIVSYKDRQDVVTTADLKSEKIILQAIRKTFPSHSIFSEEQGSDNKATEYRWIIDPLDGTKMYARGIDQFNVSLALEYKQSIVLAVIYKPTTNELYSAASRMGAFLNHKHTRINHTKKLSNSFVFTYLPTYKIPPHQSQKQWTQLQKLSKKCYRIRGSAEESLSMAFVASGKIEASLNLGADNNWHDIAPGIFIAAEAGAKITNIYGFTFSRKNFSKGFVISNGHIHQMLIDILNN